jgi:hypothetical protein
MAQHAGEVNASGLDKESSGGDHGGAAVLELGSLEPGKSRFASNVGKAHGVKVLQGGSATGHAFESVVYNSAGSLYGEKKKANGLVTSD